MHFPNHIEADYDSLDLRLFLQSSLGFASLHDEDCYIHCPVQRHRLVTVKLATYAMSKVAFYT